MPEEQKMVKLQGAEILKCDVPLGREYVEDGRVYQATSSLTTYGKVPVGATYKQGDEWYMKKTYGPAPLEPNMPFGEPFHHPTEHFPGDGDSVRLLEITDRGPAP